MRDRLIRKMVPSMPVVARWPMVPRVLDLVDRVVNHNDPRYDTLPPASLRMRIGVSNHILRNASVFDEGQDFIDQLVERNLVADGARILELGSGVGRNLMALRSRVDFDSYDGIDVDADMVRWDNDHLADERARFHHADLFSAVYNPGGQSITGYRLPVAGASIDFSLAVSVFSHLLASDTRHYAGELGRVTADGGYGSYTFFLLDHLAGRLDDRWTFQHERDGCWVENTRYPEAAVAYHQDDVVDMFSRQGFVLVDVFERDRHQQTVVFRRELR